MKERIELRSYPRNNITGTILSGGQSLRMHGKDKGLIFFEDNLLANIALSKLKKMVWQVVINANNNISSYEDFGTPVVQDTRPDFGPIAGIEAVLERCSTEYLAIAPCNMPNMPENYVSELFFGLEETGADVSYIIWKDKSGAYTREPLLALIKTNLLPRLHQYLNLGKKDILNWYHEQHYVEVSFGKESDFFNINHPEDLLN